MSNEKVLADHLVDLLTGDGAHKNFDPATKGLPSKLRGERPKGTEHSAWELVEHLRIAQWDILEFSRNPKHKSPEFPAGYWPKTQAPPNEKAWDESIKQFHADLKAMADLIKNPSTDLFGKIPHGDGQTILREALILADHNAYHLGQLILLRRVLGAWQ